MSSIRSNLLLWGWSAESLTPSRRALTPCGASKEMRKPAADSGTHSRKKARASMERWTEEKWQTVRPARCAGRQAEIARREAEGAAGADGAGRGSSVEVVIP